MLDNGQNPRLGVEPVRETRLETLKEFTDRIEMATNEAHSALQRAAVLSVRIQTQWGEGVRQGKIGANSDGFLRC